MLINFPRDMILLQILFDDLYYCLWISKIETQSIMFFYAEENALKVKSCDTNPLNIQTPVSIFCEKDIRYIFSHNLKRNTA